MWSPRGWPRRPPWDFWKNDPEPPRVDKQGVPYVGDKPPLDPYICQRCGKYFEYLDLMGDPECDCGSDRFWPAPDDKMVLAIIMSLHKRLQDREDSHG